MLHTGCDTAVLPPARHHAEYADEDAHRKNGQDNQNLWRAPLRTKEKMHSGVLLIVQRKGKQGKKNGCFKYPLKQPHEVFH